MKPRTSLRVSRRLNHCASSVTVDAASHTIIVYLYCSTWRLVTYVRRRTSRPSRPRHDVAGQSLHLDLFKAETGSEAGPAWRRGCGSTLRPEGERASDSERLERWPVAVHLTSCHDRLTGPAPDSRIGGPGPVARQPAYRSQ